MYDNLARMYNYYGNLASGDLTLSEGDTLHSNRKYFSQIDFPNTLVLYPLVTLASGGWV